MNKKLLVSGILVGALLLALPIVSSAYEKGFFWGNGLVNGGMNQGMMGHGMMNQGMMNQGMMGQGMMHGNMMYGGGVTLAEPVDNEKAKELINNYLKSSGLEGISLAEIMEFDSHYYIETREDKTGKYAHEFILDKRTGSISPEMGPNMMWNVKYGHMGGMMMGYSTQAGDKPIVSPDESIKIANDFLKSNSSSETAAEPHEFYGYYTLHTLRDGKIVGMLSVNNLSGQVWYHSWHGSYVGMQKAGEQNQTAGEQNQTEGHNH